MSVTLFEKHAPDQIREGLPYEVLQHLMDVLDLSRQEVAEALLVSERTLARRRREGRFTQAESNRLARLLHLVEQAAEAFHGHLEEAAEWLTTPKTLLGGEPPLKHADTEPGLHAVEDMLSVIQYNVAA